MQSQLSQKLKDLSVTTESAIVNGDLMINLLITSPPVPAVRPPVSIICVLDISGSMDTEATQGGAVESDGFSRLDLVKHSVNTIINSLSDNDVLGIVTFSNNARVDLQLTEMKEQNRTKASQVVTNMKTQGATNLWDGIKVGLQLTKDQKCKSRNTFVVVLTDGQPNQRPAQGQAAALTAFIKSHPLSASISMFGYGYNLDTQLLTVLTELGGGCFGYIPDCSMIGTIFVNFLSSALASFSPKLQARLQHKNSQIVQFNAVKKSLANLGTIDYGVTRNCLIHFKGVPESQQLGSVVIYFEQSTRGDGLTIKLTNKIQGNQQHVKIQNQKNQHISILQNTLINASTDLNGCTQLLKHHVKKMVKLQQSLKQQDKYLDSLIRDIQSQSTQQGQMSIALSKQQFWTKWGRHYFPALKIAHANEMCTNFKDPGLQLYGGELFKTLQGTIDTVFINLPPPTPSIKKYDAQGNQINGVVDMNNYYDQYGGCIYSQCEVLMANGSIKKIKQLNKGDIVLGLNGPTQIKCVIKTQVNEEIQIVKFSQGLIITKYHPVFQNNKWNFPIDQAPVVKMFVDSYYNFVLESGHSMIVNNIPCISLGHGFQDPVAKHAYFGSQLILKDLQRMKGWQNGNILMGNKSFQRDPITHQVIGMVF